MRCLACCATEIRPPPAQPVRHWLAVAGALQAHAPTCRCRTHRCGCTCCRLLQGVGGISDIITTTGDMNVDFADIQSVRAGGSWHCGMRHAAGTAPGSTCTAQWSELSWYQRHNTVGCVQPAQRIIDSVVAVQGPCYHYSQALFPLPLLLSCADHEQQRHRPAGHWQGRGA